MKPILHLLQGSRASMDTYGLGPRVLPAPAHERFRRPRNANLSGELIRLDNGVDLMLRPIRPDDAPALIRAFQRMTSEQVRSRVFHALTELPEPIARAMAEVDEETTFALVLVDADGGEIRGEGRVHLDHVTESAEFALAIDPAFTGKGLGSLLVSRLVDASRKAGMREIWGDTLTDNNRMLSLTRDLGFKQQREIGDAGLIRLSKSLLPSSGPGLDVDAA